VCKEECTVTDSSEKGEIALFSVCNMPQNGIGNGIMLIIAYRESKGESRFIQFSTFAACVVRDRYQISKEMFS
jgi:hypothetical protein